MQYIYDMVNTYYKTHSAISRGLQKSLQVCALYSYAMEPKPVVKVYLLLTHCFMCTNETIANSTHLSERIRRNSLPHMLVHAGERHVIPTVSAACPSSFWL